jgi:hypothetical protein
VARSPDYAGSAIRSNANAEPVYPSLCQINTGVWPATLRINTTCWRSSGRRSYRIGLRSASTTAPPACPRVRARGPPLQDLVQPCCSGRDPAIKCPRRPLPTCGRPLPVARTSRGAAAFETHWSGPNSSLTRSRSCVPASLPDGSSRGNRKSAGGRCALLPALPLPSIRYLLGASPSAE